MSHLLLSHSLCELRYIILILILKLKNQVLILRKSLLSDAVEKCLRQMTGFSKAQKDPARRTIQGWREERHQRQLQTQTFDVKSEQVAEVESLRKLPEGWKEGWSRTNGRPYYINVFTFESQWQIPTKPAERGPDQAVTIQQL